MLKITDNITINADVNTIWSFITDFSRSLLCNRFHTGLELPANYSLGKMKKFNIIHNFGLGNINMAVRITDYIPLKTMELVKENKEKLHKAFAHSNKYELLNDNGMTKLKYSTIGSFNFKIQNIPFKPILVKVMKNELINMKNMIESSDEIPREVRSKITTP